MPATLLPRNGIEYFAVLPFSETLLRIPCRAASRVPQNSKSVIVLLLPYRVADLPERNLSLYACVRDYHHVADEFLGGLCGQLETKYPGEQFACFADNSPFHEVDLAYRGGLGMKGKNGLILNETYGSYVFIAEIVTTLALEYPVYPLKSCPDCGACRRACPGGALDGRGSLKKENCASFVSQKKGVLSPEEQALLRRSGLVWGCDRCQEVCPVNKSAALSRFPLFLEHTLERFDPEFAKELCKAYAFGYRGEKVILRNYDILQSGK